MDRQLNYVKNGFEWLRNLNDVRTIDEKLTLLMTAEKNVETRLFRVFPLIFQSGKKMTLSNLTIIAFIDHYNRIYRFSAFYI